MDIKRIKRIPSHSGHARFIAATSDEPVGYIPRQQIPSPYAYSPVHTIWQWRGKNVFVVETSHRQYDVFEVPPTLTIEADEEIAVERYIGSLEAK